MTVIVTLYWIWVWISVAILARRLVYKVLRSSTGVVTTADVAPIDLDREGLTDLLAATPAPSEAGEARECGRSVRLDGLDRTRPLALPVPSRSTVSGTRSSLADALAGVRMPEDLAPLVHLDDVDLDRRLVLTTAGRPADVVSAAVADELIRLGYTIEPTGPADTLARRDDATLALHVRSIGPASAKGPADPAYPTAGAGTVVVDVSIR